MKRMDYLREVRVLNLIELNTKLSELNGQLLNNRIKLKSGLLKNPLFLKSIRREIAILNTILNQKEKQANHDQKKNS